MTRIELEVHDEIINVIQKIRNINDAGIELVIPEGSVLFDNILNLRLIEKEAKRLDKNVHLSTNDEVGQRLIGWLKDENPITETPEDFVTTQVSIAPPVKERKKFKLPSNLKPLYIVLAILIVLGIGGWYGVTYAMWEYPEAEVKIAVSTQPLTKSLQVSVNVDEETSTEDITLKGYEIQTFVTTTETVEATGQKEVGDKATGTIKIFNKTGEEKTFSSGTVVVYPDENLEFELTESVTVPARTEDEEAVPPIIIAGEAEVKVEASEIGSKYNIKSGNNFNIKGQNKDDFSGRNEKDFSGGKSELVKVVTEEDLENAKQKVNDKEQTTIPEQLNQAVTDDRTLITGSQVIQVRKEAFDAEVDEEKDEVSFEKEVLVTALAYSEAELEKLIDEMLEEFVPEGFILSTRDKNINVSVLGQSATTVLNNKTADLQVTIRTNVVTQIDEQNIQEELAGKTADEVDTYVNSIRNITSYEIHMEKTLPFFTTLPRNPDKINVTVQN